MPTLSSRNTKTKQLVSDIFQESQIPLSLEHVFTQVSKAYPQTAYSTVYRIVQVFLSEKKIVQVDWRQRGSFYEWSDRPHHHHVMCQSCGEVRDIDDAVLGIELGKVSQKTGFHITDHSIEITGLCQPCQSK